MKTNKFDQALPLYFHIKKVLQEKIASGVWKPGDQIPNEIELADIFQVSRSTVREAILQLVREGVLVRYQGKGTFVSQPKIEGELINFNFSSKWAFKQQMVHVIEKPCTASVAKALGLALNEVVYEIKRINFFHTEPAALEISYIQKACVPNLTNHSIEGRLYDLLNEKYHISITNAESDMEPVLLDSAEAGILKTNMDKPGLKITRVGKTLSGKPVILTDSLIRGDKVRMFIQSS